MQLVCISNRKQQLAETLVYFDRLMPFAEQAVVVCPADMVGAVGSPGRLEVVTLDESDVLGDLAERFQASTDHQMKNLLLRWGIARSPEVDAEFVLFDDDHRPLREITPADFVEDGRHHNFFFHKLDRWLPDSSDFDRGQHTTGATLEEEGLPILSYASHMPQVIDKALFAETFDHFSEAIGQGRALDEWSVYFNYGQARHPERFHSPRPFATLCWPALPTDWEYEVRPESFVFENFHPSLYGPGRLFVGIPTEFAKTRTATKKIMRRRAIQAAYDTVGARLRRRLCWLTHRAAQRTPGALAGVLGKGVAAVAEHGDNPAFWENYNRWPRD